MKIRKRFAPGSKRPPELFSFCRLFVKPQSYSLFLETQCDIKDHKFGCAGNGEPISTVEAYYYTPENIVKKSGYQYIYYKVNNYPFQKDTIKKSGFDGHAGKRGVIATKFQAYIDN